VLKGQKTEREVHLERSLRERETRLAELEDENRQLKALPSPTRKPDKDTWLDGNTFFDE
jgi:hypothetical protein